jgi:hypothetical protein
MELAANAPKLLGLGASTLLVPNPEPMRMLSWELYQGMGWVEFGSLAVLVIALGVLAWRRRFGSLVLVLGACAALLPVGLVSDFFWLGFDRYLYLSAVLLVVAAGGLPGQTNAVGRVVAAVGVCVVILMTAQLWTLSTFYESHDRFVRAMVEERPEDPTGYLLLANHELKRGRTAQGLDVLYRTPVQKLPPALAHSMVVTLLRSGAHPLAARILEDAAQRHPGSVFLKFDLLGLRGGQGRWAAAERLARELSTTPVTCRATVAQINEWFADPAFPPGQRRAFADVRAGASCQ